MQYVLFNPQAGNGSGAQQARALDARFPEETFSYTDMTTISDYAAWLGTLPADASLIIAGGDGTLNRFLNDTNGMALPEKLYYFATGSGNDFLHDLIKSCIICINRKLLHHKTYRCIIYTINFFDCIFHFCCTVCAIKVYHFKFFLHLSFLLKNFLSLNI